MLKDNEIGYNIQTRREYLNLSQKAVANAVGIKKPLYVAFEEGRRQISLDYLNRIAEVLDCSMVDFLTDDTEKLITTESILADLSEYELSEAEYDVLFHAKAILQKHENKLKY